MSLTKVTTALLSVAFAATLAAAPQTTKPAPPAPAKSDQKVASAKPAPPKAETVAKADLPKPVTDAVMKAHPKAEITTASKSMKDGKTWYKVSFKDGTKTGSMTLDDMGMTAKPASKGKK
jgi:hypothetical protein